MTLTRVICDRCRRPTSVPAILAIEDGDLAERLPESLELCGPCVRGLEGWLRAGQPDKRRSEKKWL